MTPKCPLCGSAATRFLFEKGGAPYWRCRACRFHFTTPTANPNLENAIGDFEPAYLQYLEPEAADAANFRATRKWMERFQPLGNRQVLGARRRLRQRQMGALVAGSRRARLRH